MAGSDAEDLPSPGDVVAGKYSVVRAIGRGGMGVVIEAQHLRLNQRVALKLLLPSIRSMREITARFEREARAIARLQGPHVARILDVESLPDGSPFMVMELLRGRELGDELRERAKIPYREAVGYILQACAAMAEAHRMGIVHRDLKPSNLFLTETEGGHRTVKVLDFGISKLTGDVSTSMTTTASAFGTPLYMSPEQVRSVKDVDARADIWSLGVVLYEVIAGQPPFNHDSATAILAAIVTERPAPLHKRCPEVPRGLSDAVMRALEKEPEERFKDVREFAAAIAPYGPPRDDPTQAVVAVELQSYEGSGGSSAGRKRLWIALSAVVALGLAGGLIAALRSSSDAGSVVPVADSTASPSATPSGLPISPSGVPRVEPAVTGEFPTEPPRPIAPSAAPSASSVPSAVRHKPSSEPGPTPAPTQTNSKAPHTPSSNDPPYL